MLPNGILRVDKVDASVLSQIRLGHYALPQLGSEIKESILNPGDRKVYIMDNGRDQLAMVPLHGWSEVNFIETSGLHPEYEYCTVMNALDQVEGEKIYITLLLWKTEGNQFTENELLPIKMISISDDNKEVVLGFNNGMNKHLLFD